MKKFLTSLVILLAAAGCQKPDPVVVDPGETTSPKIEVTPIAPADTNAGGTSVDSTGVPPGDATRFSAFLLVSRVVYDAGPAATHVETFSTAYFADRNRPLTANGRTIGYYGIDLVSNSLLPLTINDLAMFRIPYRLRIPGALRDTVFGSVFVRDVASIYQPNTVMTWRAQSPMSMSQFTTQIVTPDNVRLLEPAGGSMLRRSDPLVLRWEGRGDLFIVISRINPVTKRTIPFLKIHPKVNLGRVVIEPAILHLLPPERYFVLTFIVSNRFEKMVVGQYPGMILVQAASIHNSYVEFQ
ncbi:MAG: hypothetical protein AB1428_07685 [Bacteroidota bacterium]